MAAKVKVDQIETVDGTGNITINNSVTMAANQTLPAASVTGTHTAFRSTGIDDNADALAITIDSAENVGIGTTSVANAASWGTVLQLGDSTSCAFSLKDTGGKQFDIGTSADSLYLAYDATSGAHRLSVTDTQVKIDTGDLIFGTAGKGVVLGATTNVDANTLDDYEEGTWTPSFGADNQGFTIGSTATNTGKYVKVGSLVHFSLYINLQSSTPNGYVYSISGLPFTHVSSHYSFFPVGGTYSGANANALHDKGQWRAEEAGTTLKFFVASDNDVKNGNEVWSGSNTEYSIYVSGSYTVAF